MNLVPSPETLSGDGQPESAGPDSSLRETISRSRILVVDDQKIVRELLKVYLNAGGYRNLIFAADGDEALEIIGTETLDLVILDLQMPTIGGLEVCETVRRNPQMAYLPILVQTAADSPEDRARIFAAGATDMVGKPINDAELLARVGIHLQNRHMLNQLSRYRESMERELEAARRMQHDMMPPASMIERLEQTYPIRVRHHFQTCDALGGDIWNLWPVGGSRLSFAIVDFTGHGVVASLNTFRFQSLSMSVGDDIEENGLQKTAERLNNELSDLLPIGQFATAIIGKIDFEADIIRYVAAGGPPPFLKRPGEYGDIFCPS
jgi:sigma-B regulation protein RsbU (phosphoserine phosphatase)